MSARVYDLAEADKPCPCCGGPRVCIGEQVSEQLDYRPDSYFVVQHARKTYTWRYCEGPSERRFSTAGPAVVGPIPKGLPGPGLLAHLLTCKYADHLPLHRQVGIMARSGVRLSRSTLCNWMASSAALMRARLLLLRVIHSDDTSVPFLERGRDAVRDGHLWVYLGDRDHPYVVFDFTTHYRLSNPPPHLSGTVPSLAKVQRLAPRCAARRCLRRPAASGPQALSIRGGFKSAPL